MIEFTPEQAAELSRLEADISERLAKKPKRLVHVLRVAETCDELCETYGVDAYTAHAAALLHDWCKDVQDIELVPEAKALGIDLGVDLELVAPLLHGIIASIELPKFFSLLPDEVFQAIRVHTQGSADMSDVDMVLFVADGIEPGRPSSPRIEEIRASVGKVSLEELYWMSFTSGIEYVIETGRYLYPGTIDIYNQLVLKRQEDPSV